MKHCRWSISLFLILITSFANNFSIYAETLAETQDSAKGDTVEPTYSPSLPSTNNDELYIQFSVNSIQNNEFIQHKDQITSAVLFIGNPGNIQSIEFNMTYNFESTPIYFDSVVSEIFNDINIQMVSDGNYIVHLSNPKSDVFPATIFPLKALPGQRFNIVIPEFKLIDKNNNVILKKGININVPIVTPNLQGKLTVEGKAAMAEFNFFKWNDDTSLFEKTSDIITTLEPDVTGEYFARIQQGKYLFLANCGNCLVSGNAINIDENTVTYLDLQLTSGDYVDDDIINLYDIVKIAKSSEFLSRMGVVIRNYGSKGFFYQNDISSIFN